MSRSADTTTLLRAWSDGQPSAFNTLFPRVYDDLREIAHHRLAQLQRSDTLRTTALVHEAYLRLVDADRVSAKDRAHFLALASRAMRFILVDRARTGHAAKRGAGVAPLTLDERLVASVADASLEIIAIDEALQRLGEHSERLAQVVECRFFGGMEYADIAEAMSRSIPTVKRDWARARLWLYDFMTRGDDPSGA